MGPGPSADEDDEDDDAIMTVPESQSLGQRMLAAIMFTDVVGFSRMAGEDEERALRLVGRDLQIIADLCAQFEGRLLKNTGDGCLVLFASGVQAIECGQAIQRQFAERAQSLAADETLQHRIGIHLGDVFLSESEVMGDGVNIAARLQAEAPPGGICITQALYEVVKARLSFRTVHMGTKHLRNIPDAVQVYQVLLPSQAKRSSRALRWLAGRRSLVASAALLALAVVVVLMGWGSDPSASASASESPDLRELAAEQFPLTTEIVDQVLDSDQSRPQAPVSIAAFRGWDLDGDTRLTLEELPEELHDQFPRMDSDRDQALTFQEFEVGARQIRERIISAFRAARNPHRRPPPARSQTPR
jgi:class 3 adenylate cyclase